MRRLLILPLLFAACGEDPPALGTPDKEVCLLRRDNTTQYCIDVYEASRKDATDTEAGVDVTSGPVSAANRLPWNNITWAGARDACTKKGKRLCERDEWLDACDGQVGEMAGTKFTYGSTLAPGRCNTEGGPIEISGGRVECKSAGGTFDQNGNVREWTGNIESSAAARGGSFRSDTTHECRNGDTMGVVDPSESSEEIGFRCCHDR